MARKQGTLNVPNNAEVKAAAPFDARLVVPLKADLLTYQYPYKGMLVSVTDDTTNNGVYQLVGSDASLAASWEKVGSGVPSGGTTGQILSKVSDDDGDATWVDDQGAFLMAEECEYGSHTETREVEVEYYTWDRSPVTIEIPVVTNRKLRSTDAMYDPATFASGGVLSLAFLFERLYYDKNQSRLLLNGKVVEVDDPNPSLLGSYYFFTFRCGGTTYYVRTSTRDAKSGVFVKNNMFTQEPPFAALNAVDVSAIYSYGAGDYYEVYTRHTRTETREVEVPDYIHNVSCLVKEDLGLNPKTIPNGWGIAKVASSITTNASATNQDFQINISDLGFESADDYTVSVITVGGSSGYGGSTVYYIKEGTKTATGFDLRVDKAAGSTVKFQYVIIGKGYGSNVSEWGVAKVGTARLTGVQTAGWYAGTVSVTDLGFASGDDYTVQFSVVGGNNDWGKVGDKHVAEKTTSQFIIKGSYDGTGTAPTYVDVVYTIIARGYGGGGGNGLPEGGVAGDILVKKSVVAGDAEWQAPINGGWGIAKTGTVTVTRADTTTDKYSDASVDISDFGFTSADDYVVVTNVLNGEGGKMWFYSTSYSSNQTASSFWLNGTVTSEENVSLSLTIEYTVIAKGYGGATSGWGVAGVITTPTIATSGTYTVDISSYGFTSEDDYQASVMAENPTTHIQVPASYVNVRNRTATSFVIANTSSEYPIIVRVTLVAKGYGGSGGGGGTVDAYTKAETDALLDAKSSFDISTISTAGGGSEVHATVSQGEDAASLNYYKTTELPNALNLNVGSDSFRIPTTGYVDKEHVELTQAEYDALTDAEKNNGTTYFITDGGAYVPAVDLIPNGNQAPIVVGKLDLRGDGEFRDIKRVRLWISDLKNASGVITAGWVETGVYVRPIRIYGWFTFHDRESTQAGFKTIIQQFPIPYSGYTPYESASGNTIGLKFFIDNNNKLRMVVEGRSEFHTDDFACVIVDFMETPVA